MAAQTHELKSWPEFFGPVFDGKKTFELRRNDRHFRLGDLLWLREWDPSTAKYTGRELHKTINCVLEGIGPGGIAPLHGLSRGYVILGLE